MADTKRTTLTTRIIWFLLLVFFLVTVISQLYIRFHEQVQVEVAMLYSTAETIPVKGIYIRNEEYVYANDVNIIAYLYPDGTKIAKNSVVAKSYKNQADIEIHAEISNLEKQIEILKDAESLQNTDNSQLDSFSNQIGNKHSELMKNLARGNYSGLSDLKNDYLTLQAKKAIVRGNVYNYSDKISELEDKILELEGRVSSPPQNVIVRDSSGYFISKADGYEKKLNYDTINDLSKSDIEEIIRNPKLTVSDKIIGKIIDDYKWKFICVLETELIRESSEITLRLGSSSKTANATVVSVKPNGDGSSIFIFECDQLSSEFVENRTAQFRLLLNDYTGIRVPSKAIRFNEENERGVYIKSGVEIKFAKIEVLLVEEDFVLAKDTTDSQGYLSLYDNIVIDGKDIREGKIIND